MRITEGIVFRAQATKEIIQKFDKNLPLAPYNQTESKPHSSTRNITKSYISSSSVCIYRIYTYSSYVKSVEIDVRSSSTNSYDYKGTMNEDDKKSFTLDYNTDTYIVVEPSSYYNKIDTPSEGCIDLEASSSSPGSSSDAGTIVGAVLGALFGVGILICIIVCGIIMCNKCAKANSQQAQARQNNMAAASLNHTQPRPQIYEDINLQMNNAPPANTSYQIPPPQPLYPSPQYMDPNNPHIGVNNPYVVQPQIAVPVPPGVDGPTPIEGNPVDPVGPVQNAKPVD